MEYKAFEFIFPGNLHFGERVLEKSEMTFKSDRLFSALSFEALNDGENSFDRLLNLAKTRKILFSDAFPFKDGEYFCVKPMIKPKNMDINEDVANRKKYKKLAYLPLSQFTDYMAGKLKPDDILAPRFGEFYLKTSVNIEPDADPEPYRVGTFAFNEGCGEYIIIGYEDKSDLDFVENLLESLSFSGIGGKRSAGMGRFELRYGKLSEKVLARLKNPSEKYMLLSAALPKDEDMESVLNGANYMLEKRSGFVGSSNYSPEWRRKLDSFVFKTGSCFLKKFSGQVLDVGNGGKHPVYRYLEPMFLGVSE